MLFAGVNPEEKCTEKVKLLLDDSYLEPQDMRLQLHRGDDNLE
jgi:hypothetical protein